MYDMCYNTVHIKPYIIKGVCPAVNIIKTYYYKTHYKTHYIEYSLVWSLTFSWKIFESQTKNFHSYSRRACSTLNTSFFTHSSFLYWNLFETVSIEQIGYDIADMLRIYFELKTMGYGKEYRDKKKLIAWSDHRVWFSLRSDFNASLLAQVMSLAHSRFSQCEEFVRRKIIKLRFLNAIIVAHVWFHWAISDNAVTIAMSNRDKAALLSQSWLRSAEKTD